MYGTQTDVCPFCQAGLFENDVEMYGTQTNLAILLVDHCLRMM